MTGKPYPDTHLVEEVSLFWPSLLWLLVLAPIAAFLDHACTLPAGVIFFCAALAMVPFAKLIVQGTEQVAVHTGSTIDGSACLTAPIRRQDCRDPYPPGEVDSLGACRP